MARDDRRDAPHGWEAAGAEDPEYRYPRPGQWFGYGEHDGMSPAPGHRIRHDPEDTLDGERGHPAAHPRFDWGGSRVPLRAGEPARAPSHAGKGPRGWRRSDERILEEICREMALDSELDASDVEVSCVDGEVTLSGHVRTRRQKRLAEWIVDGTRGVHDVHNRLRVRQPWLEHGAMQPDDPGELSTETTVDGTTRDNAPLERFF